MAENIKCRAPLEDFILKVPEWRDKYLENNLCVFKVAAFVQRKWGCPYLSEPLCEEKHSWVEHRINELKGKKDLDRLEDDIEVVYRWGGGLGPMIFAQIMKNNPPVDKGQRTGEGRFLCAWRGMPCRSTGAIEAPQTLRRCLRQ